MANKNETVVNEAFSITPASIAPVILDHSDRMDFYLDRLASRHGLTTPVFVSPPGVGKTSIGGQQGEELSRTHFEVCGGNMNPSDIRVPGVNWEEQIVRYLGNDELPFVGTNDLTLNSRVLMCWDEMWDAGTMVQRIQKQGLCSNKIGKNLFPTNTLHVGFTNGSEHACYTEKLAASFANRISIYNVLPDPDDYLPWLESKALSPELEVIVRQNKDLFYDLDFRRWNGFDNFASFRTTTEVAAYFETQLVTNDGEKRVFDFTRDPHIRHKLASLVGQPAMLKIYAFLELMDAIGDFDRMLSNPSGHPLPSDLAKQWVVALKLTNEATEDNLKAIMTLASRLQGEGSFMEAFVAQSITNHRPTLAQHPDIIKWMQRDKVEICGR